MTTGPGDDQPLTVLVVCTGNICRSALAHHYLARALQESHPESFTIRSAGTGWHAGLAVPPEVSMAVPELADRLGGHTPHQLTVADLRAADLVLSATHQHRRTVLTEAPFALKRAFTILEFTQILDGRALQPGLDPAAWRRAIAEAARYRGDYSGGDIPDPYRLGIDAYEGMRDLLLPALDVLVRAATPSTGTT